MSRIWSSIGGQVMAAAVRVARLGATSKVGAQDQSPPWSRAARDRTGLVAEPSASARAQASGATVVSS